MQMRLKPKSTRPHVLILGAGASLAAFPNGDKNGRKISGMEGFFDNLGYDMNLDSHFGKNYSRNLEEIYINANQDLRDEIEEVIETHFRKLTIPDDPTIYDLILLGLRPKDLIATFNWDPFLVQAYLRNQDKFNLPQTIFLHGNIAIYYCPVHYYRISFKSGLCPYCRTRLVIPNLLYPINEKNYNQTQFLSHQWRIFQEHLQITFLITIFGYSAPVTDIAAKDLMRKAWGSPEQRSVEEFEFIDLKSQEVLDQQWQEFIHSHHRRSYKTFFESFLATHPRRTVEAYNAEILLGKIISYDPLPKFLTLSDVWDYYKPIQDEEI